LLSLPPKKLTEEASRFGTHTGAAVDGGRRSLEEEEEEEEGLEEEEEEGATSLQPPFWLFILSRLRS
jgi:hypothetical protein